MIEMLDENLLGETWPIRSWNPGFSSFLLCARSLNARYFFRLKQINIEGQILPLARCLQTGTLL